MHYHECTCDFNDFLELIFLENKLQGINEWKERSEWNKRDLKWSWVFALIITYKKSRQKYSEENVLKLELELELSSSISSWSHS